MTPPPRPRKPLSLLLPVWGSRHVRQFLELSLPSWLSPGNLPAVAMRGDARFVFLTSAADRDHIRARDEIAALERLMPVDFLLIDDLIVPRNHSTVLTLAWERALRQSPAGPSGTSFLMLLSDVLYADGTLGNVVSMLDEGAAGVMLPGLHTVLEAVEPELRERVARERESFRCPPRALVRWAFEHMHPTLTAAFVDQPVAHSVHPNNLFWRIDDDAAVARFFCMYLIGVSPEVDAFEVSAPLDYCFVPELCPSGGVVVIDDSDRGFFVECARRDHETVFLAPGPVERGAVVASLERWTTTEQRAFSRTRVIFHAGATPPTDHAVLRQSDAYIEAVLAALPQPPVPHRNHPYWGPQLSAFRLEQGRDQPSMATARPALSGRLRRLAWAVTGRAPTLRRWHPYWRDYAAAVQMVPALWPPAAAPLVVSDLVNPLSRWLLTERPASGRGRLADLLDGHAPSAGDGALLVLAAEELECLPLLIDALAARMPPGAPMLLHVLADGATRGELGDAIVRQAGALYRPGFDVERCVYVGGSLHALAQAAYRMAARLFVRGGWPRLAAAGTLLIPATLLALVDSLGRHADGDGAAGCSAVTLLLRRR